MILFKEPAFDFINSFSFSFVFLFSVSLIKLFTIYFLLASGLVHFSLFFFRFFLFDVDLFFLVFFIFIYLFKLFILSASGLSCSTWALHCDARVSLQLWHAGCFFSLQLWGMGSRACGLCSLCHVGSLVEVHELSSCGMGLVARGMWDLSSPTRDQTHVPCIGRWILYHWTTREIPLIVFLKWKFRLLRPLFFSDTSIYYYRFYSSHYFNYGSKILLCCVFIFFWFKILCNFC